MRFGAEADLGFHEIGPGCGHSEALANSVLENCFDERPYQREIGRCFCFLSLSWLDREHILVWLDRFGGFLSSENTYWFCWIDLGGFLSSENKYWFGWIDLGVSYPLITHIGLDG